MFKKTMIAAGLLAASTMGHSATWNTNFLTAPTHTDEGIVSEAAGSGVVISSAMVQLGAEYQVNDEVTFTFNQNKASNAAFPSSLYSNKIATAITSGHLDATGVNAIGSTVILTTEGGNDAGGFDKVIVGGLYTIGAKTNKYMIIAKTNAAAGSSVTLSPGLIIATAANDDIIPAATSSFTLNLLSATQNSATYRVAATPIGTSTIGTLIPTPAVNMTPAGLIGADVTVSFSAKTAGGSAMDALATAQKVGISKGSFTQTITKFDGIIDVEQSRKAFKGGNATTGSDTLTIATATTAAANGNSVVFDGSNVTDVSNAVTAIAATQTKTVHTVTGDYNWLDTNASTAGVQTTGVTVAGGATAAVLNTAGTTATITDSGNVAASTTLTIAKTAATAATLIPVQSFTGTTVYSYTSNSVANTKTVTHTSLGAFALNGAVVTAYGVPMGSTVSRFLWVNNKGTIAAPMSASVTAAGVAYGPYSVGSAAAKSSMSMAAAIDSALTAAGVVLADASRANIEFTSPVKSADLTISAAYKHIADADRLTIETSDTVVGQINCVGTVAATKVVAGTIDATTLAAGTLAATAQTTTSRDFNAYSGVLTMSSQTGTTSGSAIAATTTSENAVSATTAADACSNSK